jgi:uroporphyrinogen-III synthase
VDVAHLLGAQSIKVTTQIVYRAVAEPSLDATVREALAAGTITGVAFFSPRSAEIACTLMQVANLADTAKHIDAFCFSLNVATAAGKLAWKHLHACHIPTRHAMRELIVSHAAKTL